MKKEDAVKVILNVKDGKRHHHMFKKLRGEREFVKNVECQEWKESIECKHQQIAWDIIAMYKLYGILLIKFDKCTCQEMQ